MKNSKTKNKTIRRYFSYAFGLSFLTAAAFLVLIGANPVNAQVTPAKKTVVLVHGAFADGSSWERIIPILQKNGLNVIAVQNPLTSLADDVAATKRAIESAEGDVILVGHSWGGAVITQAGVSDKVSALVYVAAFAPSKDQSANESQSGFPKPEWLTQINVDKQGFVTLKPEAIANFFAQDLPAAETSIMAATQGATAFRCFEDKITETAWSSKPSWYIVGANDRMINPELEKTYAKKMNSKMTILPTSHVPMLSKPKEVADVILDAAGLKKK